MGSRHQTARSRAAKVDDLKAETRRARRQTREALHIGGDPDDMMLPEVYQVVDVLHPSDDGTPNMVDAPSQQVNLRDERFWKRRAGERHRRHSDS